MIRRPEYGQVDVDPLTQTFLALDFVIWGLLLLVKAATFVLEYLVRTDLTWLSRL